MNNRKELQSWAEPQWLVGQHQKLCCLSLESQKKKVQCRRDTAKTPQVWCPPGVYPRDGRLGQHSKVTQWSPPCSLSKEGEPHGHVNWWRKSIWQRFSIYSWQKLSACLKGNFFNWMWGIYKQPTANIMLHGKKLFSPRDQEPLLKVPASVVRQEKETTRI